MSLLTAGTGMVDVASTLISSVGFPICAFLLMLKANNEQSKAHKEEVEKMQTSFTERNRELMEKMQEDNRLMREVIAQNTAALDKLAENINARV